MGLALTIARRSLLRRPGRTLFSMAGIAMGVATVVAVVVLDHNTILGLSARHLEKGTPDIELWSAGAQGDETAELPQVEGVSLTARYFQHQALARREASDGKAAGRPVYLLAVEARDAPQFSVYRLADGRHLEADSEGREVLVGTELAEDLELEVGDRLWLSRPARPGKKRCEDGRLVEVPDYTDDPQELDFEVVGVLTRERLGRRSGGQVVVVDFEWGEVLFRGTHLDRRWWGLRDPNVDVERLQATLARSYSYQLNRAAILGQASDERAFRTGVRMAGLLALLLGLYVIFHTLSMSLTERIGEVGTLHALGTRRRQLARIFLLEAVLLAGGGALVGLAGGIALARLLLAVGITTMGTGKWVQLFVVPWASVLALAGLGFAIALVGSVYPLVTLRGANTVHALRGEEAVERRRASAGFHLLYALMLALVVPSLYFVIVPVVGNVSAELVSILVAAFAFLVLLVVLSLVMPSLLTAACTALTRPLTRLWPLSGQLAARAMGAAPARIGVSASALALVTAGLVGLKSITRSLQGEVEVWADEAVRDKVWVRNMPGTDFDALAAHLHQWGALAVEKGVARIYSPFLIMGVEVSELAGFGPCAEDPELLRELQEGHGMILSRRLAEDLSYQVGDPVQVGRGDGRVEEFTVVAISDAYGHYPYPDERMYGLVADHLMQAYFCVDVDTVTQVAVRLPPGSEAGIVEAAIEAFHGGPHQIVYRTGAEVREYHLRDIQRDFILFDVLIVLTAALAGLGVLNGQLLAALERTKEIGLLKALGASRRQVAGTVLIESTVVGLVGGLLGVVLGAVLSPVVIATLARLAGLTLPQTGAGLWLWAGLGGSLVVALISGLYPIWRMNRIRAVRAVRTG